MRLSVRTRLLAGYVVVLILAGILGTMAVTRTNSLSDMLNATYHSQLLPVAYTGDIQNAVMTRARDLRNVIIFAKDETKRSAALNSIAAADQQISKSLAKYKDTAPTEQEKQLLASFESAYVDYKNVADDIAKTAIQGQVDTAIGRLDEAAVSVGKVEKVAEQLKQHYADTASKEDDLGDQEAAQTRVIVIGLLAVVILVGLTTGIALSHDLSRSVATIHLALERLAMGDLNRDMDERTKDKLRNRSDELGDIGKALTKTIVYMRAMAEHAQQIARGNLTEVVTPLSDKDELGLAFEEMVTDLRQIVGGVASSARALEEASHQLSSSSGQAGDATQQIATTIQQVASGTQDQSSAAQDTASSVDQLSRAIDQIAAGAQDQSRAIEKASASVAQLNTSITEVTESSQEVSAATTQAQDAAQAGAKSVEKTANGMSAIKASTASVAGKIEELGRYSEQIGSIVQTIDDIAEQTNLLALNAAIEAARAGEHGRGFAVVADEVRKLAERSSKSTKEIADLIGHVQKGTQDAVVAMGQEAKEVESGASLAEEAAKALSNILTAVKSASNQVSNIANAVKQMEAASQEVVGLMDSVSAVVEESSAATQQMAASSQQVSQAIERVASVSEQTSAAAEEVSASTEEMSAQVEEMVAQAQTLDGLAKELHAAVSRFNLGNQNERSVQPLKLDARAAQPSGTARLVGFPASAAR
ncbi:MAG TPA: methyl-accepting chemotaxis protein [Chloroflexota bacterium]|nr:methyl-accepting chemotaxis protein [Chloroflexota bacterium]